MDILAATCAETADYLRERYGKKAVYAPALYNAVCKQGLVQLNGIETFAQNQSFADCLQKEIVIPAYAVDVYRDEAVEKFITHCTDGELLESVIIPLKNRTTLCVSSQVGCRMGCTFCATGAGGFVRNATTTEITGQLFTARFTLKKPIDNIVFMGMGEPLDNADAVVQAIRVFSDQRGFNIPLRSITISTAGHVEGLQQLAQSHLSTIRIAVSINAAHNALRSRLMPINNKYPLEMLKRALQNYPLTKKGIFLIEYVLIDGVNDSKEAADALAVFVAGLPVRINVIGLNAGAGKDLKAPAHEKIRQFCGWLVAHKLFVRQRTSHGSGIMAACGQLRKAVVEQ